MNDDQYPEIGLSRRAMLKRAGVVGAAAWAVPVVYFVSATPASAASPSAPSHGNGNGAQNRGNAQTGGITAQTGLSVPVKPTVIAASAAVAVGAGTVAATHFSRRGATPSAPPFDGVDGDPT